MTRRSATATSALLVALALGSAAAILAAVCLGEQSISLARAWADPASSDAVILWSLRLPRALLAGLVGSALAASGCALQALLRNPLADPFVLGVSGGAALGATVALALGLGTLSDVAAATWLQGLGRVSAPGAFAFLGSLLATVLVLAGGRTGGGRSPYAALLTGVIFNAFASAAITCVKTLTAPEKVGEILYWLAGTLGYESRWTLLAAALFQCLPLGFMWALSGRLNLLTLGDDEAASLGVPVARTRVLLLVAASLSVAGAVALSGLVGFVGLIVPHVLRLWLGPDQRVLLPASILAGAGFLALSDLAARLLFQALHVEPPVGVVTALLGGPFFLVLLLRTPLSAAPR